MEMFVFISEGVRMSLLVESECRCWWLSVPRTLLDNPGWCVQMEEINEGFPDVDVALVIGA
jgi:hypothetical protein